MAEGVALHLLAALKHLLNDAGGVGAFADEHADAALPVHDGLQPRALGLDVHRDFGHINRIDRLAFRPEVQPGNEVQPVQPLAIGAGGRGGQPAAVPPHDLVDQQRARARGRLVDDVLEEDRALLGGGERAERLAHRNDVVVDRLRHADDGQRITVVPEIAREVGGGGRRVVAADRVEDGDLVPRQLVGGDLQRMLAFLDEAALHGVGDVGELHAAVPDRRAAVLVEGACPGARLLRDLDRLAHEKPAVAAEIADDLDLRGELRVAQDQLGHRRGEAGGEAAGGQHGDFVLGHRRSGLPRQSAQILGSDAEIKPARSFRFNAGRRRRPRRRGAPRKQRLPPARPAVA